MSTSACEGRREASRTMSGSRKSPIATGDQGLHHGIRVGVPQADLRAAPRVLAWRGDRQVDPERPGTREKKPVSDSDRARTCPTESPSYAVSAPSSASTESIGAVPTRARVMVGAGSTRGTSRRGGVAVPAGQRRVEPSEVPLRDVHERGRAGPAAEVLVAAAHGEVGPRRRGRRPAHRPSGTGPSRPGLRHRGRQGQVPQLAGAVVDLGVGRQASESPSSAIRVGASPTGTSSTVRPSRSAADWVM